MKTSSIFIILIISALLVLSIQSLIQYRANIKVHRSMQKMEEQMDKASHELSQARSRMESLKQELYRLQNFIDSSSLRVRKLNEGKQITAKQYEAERIKIVNKLDHLYISIDSTKKSLPDIQIQE